VIDGETAWVLDLPEPEGRDRVECHGSHWPRRYGQNPKIAMVAITTAAFCSPR
jgi:hypothetical protein